MHVYVYVYICLYAYMYIYMYIYIKHRKGGVSKLEYVTTYVYEFARRVFYRSLLQNIVSFIGLFCGALPIGKWES